MNKVIITAAIAAALAGASASAQTVAVSPTPRQAEWGAKAFDRPAGVAVSGADEADADALRVITAAFPASASGISLTIGERGDKAVAAYTDKIPGIEGGYYLSITPGGVVIAGNDEKGTFYGAQSFLQIASQPQVMSVEITDWPEGLNRGVVEGFYGNPWSFEDRLSQFDFYGANKLDTYIYGPKDDPYHHGRWREPYPDDKVPQMKEMAASAARNKVWFVWAMHPGNAIVSDDDRRAALAKLELMYEMGFRSFAIFFDDISNYSAANQASYLNFLTDNFVKKHSDVTPMIMCPSEYNRGWAGNGSYLVELGEKMYPEVRVMWTGNSVVDMINVSDLDWVRSKINRDPLIWLNYPVNDYGQHNLLMGPFYGNDNEVPSLVAGFTANPMQYAEASKVALYQMADFLWNPEGYDCDASWERSMEAIMPGHAEAFRTFCINNVDLAPNTHGLRRWGESPDFKAILDAHPDLDAEATPLYRAEFNKMKEAATELLDIKDSRMVSEIREFIQCFGWQGERGALLADMADALRAKDADAFVAAYTRFKELTKQTEALVSRGFEGSIQRVVPHTGTLYVEPFISSKVNSLIADFKDAGLEAPADLFPAQVIENGLYFIRHDGRYLTNKDAGATGGFPVFTDELDVVNPNRQGWRIRLDPDSKRFSIINLQDERFLNEKGEFTVNEQTNPFESAWHTYNIYRHNADFAIQNGGSAGSSFWTVDGNRIIKAGNDTLNYSRMIFTIEPFANEMTFPMIEDGHKYYIIDNQGRYLTNANPGTSGGNPTFVAKPRRLTSRYEWTLTLYPDEGRVDLRSVADGRYVNEKGVFGTNEFYPDWNTYEFYACGDTYALRCGGAAGKNYWGISGDRIVQAGENNHNYLFRVVDVETAGGLEDVAVAGENSPVVATAYYDLSGRRLSALPSSGVVIVKMLHADGTVSADKIAVSK